MTEQSKQAGKFSFEFLLIKIRFLISVFLFAFGSQLLTIFTFIPLPLNKKSKRRFRELILMRFARFINAISFNISIKRFNSGNEKFESPAIIISNHVSVIDISLILSLTPRIVIITNPEVKRSKYKWLLKKYTNLHLISDNIDTSVEFLKDKISEGYSILIFPEGHRSPYKIKRFHKGAFMFAEIFKLDILPVFIKAEGDFLNKNSFFVHSGKIQLHILPRIKNDNKDFGDNLDERTKKICQYYRHLNSEFSDRTTRNS